MDISPRKKQILRIIVEIYVQTAEPVGSKAVVTALGSKVSSATVRNEMVELEALGYLEQPHTSAGRMPSTLGYRTYVDELMKQHALSTSDTLEINNALKVHPKQLPQFHSQAGKLTSRLTTYPAYALASATGLVNIVKFDFIYIDPLSFIIVILLSNDLVKNKLVHLMIPTDRAILLRLSAVFNASFAGIPEERITPELILSTERAVRDTTGLVAIIAGFTIELLCEAKTIGASVTGEMKLFNHPEYRDVDKAQRLINYLSDDKELTRLPSPETSGEVKITIGAENLADELKDSSVVAVRYNAGEDMQGLIGVVGPTRMDYSKVAARLSYIAQGLGQLITMSELTSGEK